MVKESRMLINRALVKSLRQLSAAEEKVENIDMDSVNGKKVVYIEDNLANLRFMEKVLCRKEGLILLTAESALEGIALIRSEKPNLILMDIQMPVIDGYEAFAKLQEDKETRAIPVVAVSANAMETDIRYAHERGFKGYLTKPIDIQLLYVMIDEFLC